MLCWTILDIYQPNNQGNLLLPSGEVAQNAHRSLVADGPEASFGECTALLLLCAFHL
jgi:hypothetical protein